MRLFLRLALISALSCLKAWAQADPIGLGSGKDGPLVVSNRRTVNVMVPLLTDRVPGDDALPVASVAGFAPDDVVLVWQTWGLEAPAPDTSPLDLTSEGAGRYELARVLSIGGGAITLTAPLRFAYAAAFTQVVRVPQYTDVTIEADAGITAPAWNGVVGGLVGFLATGTVTVDGVIDASGSGFRGAAGQQDTDAGTGCEGLDEPMPAGARKGEGLVPDAGSPSGRGNVANGGGGGVCFRSGGGGGGSAGRGGMGGKSTDGQRVVGGLGGAALVAPPSTHLFMGGGGGGGHATLGSSPRGGNGGGVLFVRAATMAGTGRLTAAGRTGQGSGADACGGGGAGGTVLVQVTGPLRCGSIDVTGGAGGQAGDNFRGPGGGGAGGLIAASAEDTSGCAFEFAAGPAGTHPGFGNPGPYGATPATPFEAENLGRVEVACPAGVACVRPDAGLWTGVRFVSTPRDDVECGSPYVYDEDGLPELSEPGPWTFDVVPSEGHPLPFGLSIDAETGAVNWTPESRQKGVQHFRLRATRSAQTLVQDVTVQVYCSTVRQVGCTHVPGMSLAALLLLTALGRALLRRG